MKHDTNKEISERLIKVFKDNWKENFLFDSLKDRSISYELFFSAVLNTKQELEKHGVKKDDFVCLLMHNSAELMVLYISCLAMGVRAAPVDPMKGSDEIKEIIKYINYKLLIHNLADANVGVIGIADYAGNKIHVSELGEIFKLRKNAINELNVFEKQNYNELFLLSFTSGSTGIPKGVMNSFKNLYLTADAFRKAFDFNNKNIFYHNLPMTYMAGILNMFIKPLISGSKIIVGKRFSAAACMRFWDAPIKYKANTFWILPTMIALLLKVDRGSKGIDYCKSTRVIGCVGTAPLSPIAKKEFQAKYGVELYESYGLSETLFVTTNSPKLGDKMGSVGKPLKGVELSFAKDGEILISVPWMFLGYSNVETAEYFTKGKYASGDIGKFDKDGFLIITGRKKDLIIKGGVNISPKKIEQFIEQLKIFEEAIILGFKDQIMGEKAVCFYVPRKSNSSNEKEKEVNQEITQKLGKEHQIDVFIKMDSIPKHTNGKIDKLKIRAMYENKL